MPDLIKWDLYVLDNFYQEIANMVWKQVEVNCFMLARVCLVLWTITDLADTLWFYNAKIFMVCITAFCSILNFGSITLTEKMNTNPKFLNFARTQHWFRLIWIGWCAGGVICYVVAPDLSTGLHILNGFLFASMLYFQACNKLPPLERKQWFSQPRLLENFN